MADPIPKPALVAVGAVLIAGGVAGVLIKRLAGGAGGHGDAGEDGRGPSRRAPEEDAAPSTPEPQEWQCACGQEIRMNGEGRHRVFWAADAAPEDPILDDRCPNCERELQPQL